MRNNTDGYFDPIGRILFDCVANFRSYLGRDCIRQRKTLDNTA